MSDPVLYEVAAGVATLTLNRPERRNALSAAVINGLGDALGRVAEDPDVRLVVLTNEGPAFCAGADLSGQEEAEPRYTLPEVFTTISELAVPVVGRIAGHCMGGGVGLAAVCDVSIAADDVLLGFTEVRLGVIPAVISVICLPKMRHGDALELFLTGERIPASRAANLGLLNAAVPRAELDEAVGALCDKLLRGGPQALAMAKQLVHVIPGMDRAAAYAWAHDVTLERFASAEAAAGMAAFRERRDPPWVPGGVPSLADDRDRADR